MGKGVGFRVECRVYSSQLTSSALTCRGSFRVRDFGFGISGFGFRVSGLGFRVSGCGNEQGFGFGSRIANHRFGDLQQISSLRDKQDSEFGV
jgi:hypothetical protein